MLCEARRRKAYRREDGEAKWGAGPRYEVVVRAAVKVEA
jgi:hypothetical protein